jgi:hypothetical protein
MKEKEPTATGLTTSDQEDRHNKDLILSHKDLANHIAGRSILHLNSLGKDAVICLEWLNNYAHCSKIISVYFRMVANHPDDDRYLAYLRKRYPRTQFVERLSVVEMNEVLSLRYQSPLKINYVINPQEFEEFNTKAAYQAVRKEYDCDYLCSGLSCYEGMGRAMYMRRVGLCDEKIHTIFPMGLMKYRQVLDLIKKTGVKLHPSYKFHSESHDTATYFKMRNSFTVSPEHKRRVYKLYPILALDRYRWEVLMKRYGNG